jgi:hypothetical protein
MNLKRIVGGLVNDQIRSRLLMHNFQINDMDELWRTKEELNDSQVMVPQSSLIVDLLRVSSWLLDHF